MDDALAALSAFALIDRERVPNERDPAIVTKCVRLHRLVRQVAAPQGATREEALAHLVTAMVAADPGDIYDDPGAWPPA